MRRESSSRTADLWIACSTAYGDGGLARHLAELVEAARADGSLAGYFCPGGKPGDALACTLPPGMPAWLPFTPLRFSPGWINFLGADRFDRSVARAMRGPQRRFTAFGGQALHAFARARALGAQQLELVAANSHVQHVQRRHAAALRRDPLEASWLNAAQIGKTLREYAAADVIQVASEYSRQSFLDAGFAAQRLRRVHLQPHPRFVRPATRPDDGRFRIVYVGSLTAMKGIPLLIEAFRRLPVADCELTLVGGWATRGMRRYLQRQRAEEPRIRILPGDPLLHLQQADACVHPSFEDGFGYAPAEALACGTPVIASADTGMKELIVPGQNGYVVPTGDVDALIERLLAVRAKPLARMT